MTIKYVTHTHWDIEDDLDTAEYEYADTGMSQFMCPTEWIKKNFIPLNTYALPHINTLSEIAKYRNGYTS